MTDGTSGPLASGHDAAPGRAAPGPALALILTLAVGFVAVLLSPGWRARPEGRLVDGTLTAELEASLLEGSPLGTAASSAWAAIDLAVFRQGLPGVLIGEEGWLFSTEEFAASEVEPRFTTEAPVARVAAVRERLAADGVDLLVALVPAKARVADARLGRHRLPEAAAERYGVLRAALAAAGVEVIDGARALAGAGQDGAVFLRTDTHWTPAGAAAVAEAIAARVAERHAGADWLGATPFELVPRGELVVEGDLLAFVPLGPLADALGPAPDRIEAVEARAAAAPADPFGPVELPVTLVGTSYSADPRWGFADRLRAALGADVLVAASEGEGPFAPMDAYLAGEAYRAAPPEVVVWEIPERYAWPEVGW